MIPSYNPVRAILAVAPTFAGNPTPAVAPTKQAILSKTHYGTTIYSHILRQYYQGKFVMKIVGRDCGLCPNPFNDNKETLHIFIHKERILMSALDKEYALHEDTENAIPAGDPFDFAELHYKQQGDELYQTLNNAMYLHIGEKSPRYPKRKETVSFNQGNHINPINHGSDNSFSFFKAPITNTTPRTQATLHQIYNAIKGTYYKAATQKLRTITDEKQARRFKTHNFDYCTFSGVFATRNDRSLIKHSGLLCLDFDHLPNLIETKARLLADEYFETQLLFTSPSGTGLKWIIPINTATAPHSDYFTAVANYIKQTYNLEVDKSGKDLSRACFLPHDPYAYISPKMINL